MKGSLGFDPSFYEPVADAVSQPHKAGILVRRLRISAQGVLDVAKYLVFQNSRSCGRGGRSSNGIDFVASCSRKSDPERFVNSGCAQLYWKSGRPAKQKATMKDTKCTKIRIRLFRAVRFSGSQLAAAIAYFKIRL
jgi:hypothetical protein